jgi:hypothetical protein
MGASDKRGTTGPAGPAQGRRPIPTPVSAGSTLEASQAFARDVAHQQAPYVRFAFANPYNLSLFLGTLGAATLTMNPLLALVALGGEAIWLLHAPGSPLLRRSLWDPRLEQLRAAEQARAREARVRGLEDSERRRVEALVAQQQQIRRLAATNPSFTGELLRTEVQKTDRLVEAFIDMAVTCARYEAYLESVDVNQLDRDRARYERTVQAGAAGDQQVEIAKKNLAILARRQDKMKEIQRYLSVARGQLDLIENSFQLIADQIVTMQSPQELSGQLDELLDGVDAIRQSAADTEQMLSSIGLSSTS